ncbi:NmrA family NAD(P)-binding protein [Rhodococcus sp. MSC1_016]|uniref:NmrA family NAD(P)-binding protein n=1 Tax=Rhodococcus sp. MSC1_016 TaxID=2909266 RepID=UPI002030BD72|nr:NAD(P)H-binding protein [Rhodococcus sp. MSC1_016]
MTILVTGATGNIGRMLVDHLLARGATDVRALTNHPEKAHLPAGVEVVHGYLRRLDTLPAAFDGVESMYLAPTPDTVEDVLAVATRAGVRHLVDLSGPHDGHWGDVARAVEASGIPWTHLWPGEFMENAGILAPQIKDAGVVREPFPTAGNAPIAMDDIAEVAAVTLLEDGHIGKSYELTGPETLLRAELVRRLGAALGRNIEYRQVSFEEAVEVLTPAMGEYARWYLEGMATLVDHPQQANSVFEDIVGRPATTFTRWAAEHVHEFGG